MGCRILHDQKEDIACLYCSTSGVAFGPLFHDWSSGTMELHDAEERAESFLRWIASEAAPWTTFEGWNTLDGRRDPRVLTDSGLDAAYTAWLAQEADQWHREQQREEVEP